MEECIVTYIKINYFYQLLTLATCKEGDDIFT